MSAHPNLLHQITCIHIHFHKSKLKLEHSSHTKRDLHTLQEFLQLNPLETILLSSIIHLSFRDSETNLAELAEHYGMESCDFLPYLETISKLSEQGFIEQDDSNLYRRLLNSELRPHPRVMEALLKGKPDLIRQQEINSVGIFFSEYDRILAIRKKRTMSKETFMKTTSELCCKGNSIPFVKYLNRQKLPAVERNVLLSICLSTLCGTNTISVNVILKDFFEDLQDYYQWACHFRGKENSLSKKLLIEVPPFTMGPDNEVMLAGKINSQLFQLSTVNDSLFKETEMCTIISPDTILPIQLYYPQTLAQQINFINRALQTRHYKTLQKKLAENDLRKGLTILLYGAPGTGKTETVYQLAQQHQRTILLADASKIKSMWIGEGEKNIRKVFSEYRNASKTLKNKPILLFNEADAILSGRRKIITGADSADNTMQNILLQELEDFDGIFLATTNQMLNLDAAFERRFLYKIEFTLPDSIVRKQILRNKLKRIRPEWLDMLADKYVLNGAQIENIKRKLIMEETLTPDYLNSLEKIEELFLQESHQHLGTSAKNKIGFVQKYSQSL